MSTFTLQISCDNDAFGETDKAASLEIARILRHVASRVQNADGFETWEMIRDANGNDVGRFAFKDYEGQGVRKIRSPED